MERVVGHMIGSTLMCVQVTNSLRELATNLEGNYYENNYVRCARCR